MELTTARLLLRPIQKEDAAQVFSYRSDAVVNEYQGWVPKTIEDVFKFIENGVSPNLNVQDTWFQFVLIVMESGALIGDIGLHFLDIENREVEIGCTVAKHHQRKGFASEALEVVIDFLFRDLNKQRIVASIEPMNKASIALVKNLGMTLEINECTLPDSEKSKYLTFAVSAKDWDAKG